MKASPASGTALPVTPADIEAAARRLDGVARKTPLLRDERIDEATGGRILIKAEPLQRTGSFKFRGAYNAISQVEADAVVAFSSGNHAQGVALAARLLGKNATIVMPADAPTIKQAATRAHGAELRCYDRYREVREAIGAEIAQRSGAELVKPYDDVRVIAGQGTAGLEMAAQAREMSLVPDVAVICTGGGGLTAGCATALSAHFPGIAVYSAEPQGFDDHKRSLDSGERVSVDPDASSICDALLAPTPGEITYQINRRLLAGGLVADDAQVLRAMRIAFERLKVVVEPGGAIALAAALFSGIDLRGKTALVMLSGGNVDPSTFARCLEIDQEYVWPG